MGDEIETKIYFKENMKWYKKLWYFITFRKHKIPQYKELGRFKSL